MGKKKKKSFTWFIVCELWFYQPIKVDKPYWSCIISLIMCFHYLKPASLSDMVIAETPERWLWMMLPDLMPDLFETEPSGQVKQIADTISGLAIVTTEVSNHLPPQGKLCFSSFNLLLFWPIRPFRIITWVCGGFSIFCCKIWIIHLQWNHFG